MILVLMLTLCCSPYALADSVYDIIVNVCLRTNKITTQAELVDAMAFLTYTENVSQSCVGRSQIDFITPSSFDPENYSAQVSVEITANCSEAQEYMIKRIEGDERFKLGSMGWCL